MKNFSNKTVLITGASRGLGAALAEAFWQQQANLVLLARDINLLEQLKHSLIAKSKFSQQFCQVANVDLSKHNEVDQFIRQLIKQHSIDILINNAAIHGEIKLSWQVEQENIQQVFATNLLAPIHLCQAVVPAMLANRFGRIINLSGGGATNCRPNFAVYASSKAGLVKFTETLAAELKTTNITANCIAPGMLKTRLLDEILAAGSNQVSLKEYQQAQQLKTAETDSRNKTIQLCLYLASEKAQAISGRLISAVWDNWQDLTENLDLLGDPDIYTLRRKNLEDED